jgi:hypothetical protein
MLRILLIRVPVVVSICFQNQDKILRILRCDMEIYFQNRFLIFYSTFLSLGCSKRYHFVAFLLTLSHFGTPFLMLQTQIEKKRQHFRSPSGNFSGLILISDQISSSRCSFGSVIFVPLHFQIRM